MIKFTNVCLSTALSLGLVVGVPLGLPSCAPAASSSVIPIVSPVQQAVTDAQNVLRGVMDSYAALKTLYPQAVSSAVDAQIQTIFSATPDLLSQLSATVDPVTTAASLRGVESAVNQVLNLVSATLSQVPGVPPALMLGFQAAAVLLPIIENTANQLVPASVSHVGVTPPRFKSSLTVAQARAALKR